MSIHERAATFRRLHAHDGGGDVLVLPNAWDAMSARVIEMAGARAIATTSWGVSWSLGRPDGHGLTRDEMVGAVRRIAATVQIPVTADVEGGYGDGTPDDVAETVRAIVGAGAVGVNLEDSAGRGSPHLLDADRHAARIAAARAAAAAEGVALFVNARVDPFLRQVGAPESRLDETLRRAAAYVAAGADGIFVPGVIDPATIAALVASLGAPLNVLAGPGAPSVAELRALGVARVSVGGAIAASVMAHVRAAATEMLRDGTYESVHGELPFAEANALFSRS